MKMGPGNRAQPSTPPPSGGSSKPAPPPAGVVGQAPATKNKPWARKDEG